MFIGQVLSSIMAVSSPTESVSKWNVERVI